MNSAHGALVSPFIRIRLLVKASAEGGVDQIIRDWIKHSPHTNLLSTERE